MNFDFFKNELVKFYSGTIFFLVGVFMVLSACDDNLIPQSIQIISLPFQKISNLCEKVGVFFEEKSKMQMEIDSLKAENEDLKSTAEKYETLKLETEKVAKLEEVSKKYKDCKIVAADIKSCDFDENILTAELCNFVKTTEKVSVGDAVVGENGMVGKISSVDGDIVRVLTLNSPDSKIGVFDESSGDIGVLQGNEKLKNENKCLMTLIPAKNQIKDGDVVSTSGMSGLFPKNLRVGVIDKVDFDSNTTSYYAVVKFNEDILEFSEKLGNIYVITDYPEKGNRR